MTADAVDELNVDGIQDAHYPIWYIGKAYRQPDGTWRCLADVNGQLCLVQVSIKREEST